MFKIRNISNGKIILGDLNLIISKDSEIDLDTLHTRERLEQSQSLHRCLQPEQKKLVIIQKDNRHAIAAPQVDPAILAEMEARLRSEINDQLALQPLPQEQESMSDVKKQLDFLIKYVTTQPKTVIQQTSSNQQTTEEIAENTERSIEIQEKLLQRLGKNVESKVDTKEETKKSDIDKRAGELEDLI